MRKKSEAEKIRVTIVMETNLWTALRLKAFREMVTFSSIMTEAGWKLLKDKAQEERARSAQEEIARIEAEIKEADKRLGDLYSDRREVSRKKRLKGGGRWPK